jgi:hypothetical protein
MPTRTVPGMNASMILRRALLPICLALLVALTAQNLAVARGQPQAAGQIELCADGRIVTVAVDHAGNPIGPPRICPDVVLALMAALALPEPGALPLVRIQRLGQDPESTDAISHVHIPARARDPPLSA